MSKFHIVLDATSPEGVHSRDPILQGQTFDTREEAEAKAEHQRTRPGIAAALGLIVAIGGKAYFEVEEAPEEVPADE